MKDKIELTIYALSNSYSASTYALVLTEKEGERKMLVIISETEAQLITLEFEGMKPPRPLTHDLVKSLADGYGIQPVEVYIDKFHEGIFTAQITFIDSQGEVRVLDSRTSDAVIVALKNDIPIYTSEKILKDVGIIIPNTGVYQDENEMDFSSDDELSIFSMKELEEQLSEAEEVEEYERAALIMEEIQKRNRS